MDAFGSFSIFRRSSSLPEQWNRIHLGIHTVPGLLRPMWCIYGCISAKRIIRDRTNILTQNYLRSLPKDGHIWSQERSSAFFWGECVRALLRPTFMWMHLGTAHTLDQKNIGLLRPGSFRGERIHLGQQAYFVPCLWIHLGQTLPLAGGRVDLLRPICMDSFRPWAEVLCSTLTSIKHYTNICWLL